MNNPYTNPANKLSKLIQQHKDHGQIVIGIDFDFTLFDSSKGYEENNFYEDILELVLRAQYHEVILCLWTASHQPDKVVNLCKSVGLYCDYINDSPLFPDSPARKPHFNLLLDDSAGLGEAKQILELFLETARI